MSKTWGIDAAFDEPKALESQVAGSHYTDLGMQPLEITYANFGYEGIRATAYTKVNKYLTREKGEHRENIEKAIHVLEIQLELFDRHSDTDALDALLRKKHYGAIDDQCDTDADGNI